MKVFLSWSGDKSHKVALVFRDWLPSVIQSIVPYVSSEDIDKGARWSSDIAQELEDSTFGILCVTKENLTAPWLNFEAGALSKTMDKSLVCPFLFNIKRSEVKGPVLQFQSTIFEKEDIKKLVQALNTASNPNGLTDDKLNKAFEVWYPELETKLKQLTDSSDESEDGSEEAIGIASYSHIFEEILDLSRTNQKLLRNPEGTLEKDLATIKNLLAEVQESTKRNMHSRHSMRRRKYHPMMIEEVLHAPFSSNSFFGVQMVLSFFKEDFPWLYDAGVELIQQLKAKGTPDKKFKAIEKYRELLDFTFHHPMMRDFYRHDEEAWMWRKELPHLLMRTLERNLHEEL
jgi:hypothetical protein